MVANNNDNNNNQDNGTILIDCRNTKECEVGHFQGAIDPNTTTFAQFPHWVDQNKHLLQEKRVLMYCTGGIRCEKASAYIRRQVPSAKSVQHLKGGIHKYLEAMDNSHEEPVWLGKNFVFHTPVETKLGCNNNNNSHATTNSSTNGTTTTIVGRCIYCEAPYDNFDPKCVCTVCREPCLACPDCQQKVTEFHCKNHFHLRDCYFSNLTTISEEELQKQLLQLETILTEIAVGKRFKQKRKTLQKQCNKIRQRLLELADGGATVEPGVAKRCRNCDDTACTGRCWGFYSLKRKEALEQRQQAKQQAESQAGSENIVKHQKKMMKTQDNKKRGATDRNRDRMSKEISDLNLSVPPSAHRDPKTGIRVPPPCTRILQTKMKGKWKGKPVLQVVKEEFHELSKPGVLDRLLEHGLLRVNDVPVTTQNAGTGLMTGDTISRIVHWHEPPVIVPESISVQKVGLSDAVKMEFGIDNSSNDSDIYVCNKPSSLPVHPAGPYLSNSLTLMIEAQEKLDPQSLSPCHRTDRVTSGLTICCTNSIVARIIQRSMCEKQVKKLYLARVHGKFVASEEEVGSVRCPDDQRTLTNVQYSKDMNCVQVDAPIETVDPSNGIRKVTDKGKPATSLFRLLSYDPVSEVSLLACQPITGRSHQLRVHLQLLGFPIVGDVLYGGRDLNQATALQRQTSAIDSLIQSTRRAEPELRVKSVTDSDGIAARNACGLCHPFGHESAECSISAACTSCFFTPAQLLKSGHAIDLHAYRYRVDILPSKKNAEGSGNDPVGVLDLIVAQPAWASSDLTSSLAWLDGPSTME
eukprot:Sro174_g076540.2  (806) ;mRNA; r:13314-15731